MNSFYFSLDNRCRSSTIDLQNPQCPVCQLPLNGQDIITHVQHEIDRQQYKYRRGNKVYFNSINFYFISFGYSLDSSR